MAKLGVVVHYLLHQLLDDRPRHTLQRSEAALSDGCKGFRTRSLKLANRANRHTLKAAPAAAILVSESVPRVKRRKRRNGFRQSGADWETAAACVKMETESSVPIRPLIATPAQGVSRSRAETDVLLLSAAAGSFCPGTPAAAGVVRRRSGGAQRNSPPRDDAITLPRGANPDGMKFSERTT